MLYVCREQEGEDHLLDSQWIYLLRSFTVEEISHSDINDLPVVVFQPKAGKEVGGVVNLTDFVHPTDSVVYKFGGSHSVMKERELIGLNVTDLVYIPIRDDWELFSSQAAAIVLWDRTIKHG